DHGHVHRGGAPGRIRDDEETITVVVETHTVEHDPDLAGSLGPDGDSRVLVVGDSGVRHRQRSGRARLEDEAVADAREDAAGRASPIEIAKGAVFDGQCPPGIEYDAIAAAETDAFEGKTAQRDGVVRRGIDGDAIETARHKHTGLA